LQNENQEKFDAEMKEIEDFERQEQENKGFNQKFNINPDKQKEILAK